MTKIARLLSVEAVELFVEAERTALRNFAVWRSEMLGWAIALPIVGTYIITSVVLLNFPWLVHKKKKLKFRCRHISHRGGK